MNKTAYVIRHVAFEDLGSWHDIIKQNYVLKYLDAGYDDLNVINLDNPDLLIILGGPIGVYDDNDYPFLLVEQAVIRNRVLKGLPVLGVCLGAQLIASAMGGLVYKGNAPEIGWSALSILNSNVNSYFRHFANENVKVLHWHGDTFDLPPGAILQASSSLYVNQAFTIDKHVLALQFHPEVTERGMERWFIGHSSEISHNNINLKDLRRDTQKYATSLVYASNLFLKEWLEDLK